MGIASVFGYQGGNPFLDALASNRSALLGLGAGIAGGGPDFGRALSSGLQLAAQGQTADFARQEKVKADATLASQLTKTQQYLQRKYPDLAAELDAGAPMDAIWSEAMRRDMPKQPAGPIKASPGDVFLDPTTYQPVASVPAAADKPTSGIQEYEYAKSQGYAGTFEQFKTDVAKAGAANIDFNQNQGVAAGFADRMSAANQVLSDPKLLSAMTDPSKAAISGIPVAGNYMVGPEFQMAQQAQRDFINAILRRESGAVISPSEFENAKQQYFPQPGDSPEVIAQKAQNREIAIQGVIRAAGPNYATPSLTPPGVQMNQTTNGVQWSVSP